MRRHFWAKRPLAVMPIPRPSGPARSRSSPAFLNPMSARFYTDWFKRYEPSGKPMSTAMNDAFLHEIRIEPPRRFIVALKERFDRTDLRRTNRPWFRHLAH